MINARYGDGGEANINESTLTAMAGYHSEMYEVAGLETEHAGERPPQNKTEDLTEAVRRNMQRRRKAFLKQYHDNPDLAKSDRICAAVALIIRQYEATKAACAHLSPRARRKYMATHKLLVFSEFLSSLDFIDIWLKHKTNGKIQLLHYNGTMMHKERDANRNLFEASGKYWDAPALMKFNFFFFLITSIHQPKSRSRSRRASNAIYSLCTKP